MIRLIDEARSDYEFVENLLRAAKPAAGGSDFAPLATELEAFLTKTLELPDSRAVVAVSNAPAGLYALVRAFQHRLGRPLRFVTSGFGPAHLVRGPLATSAVVDCDATGLLDLERVATLDPGSFDGLVVPHLFASPRRLESFVDFATDRQKLLLFDATSAFRSDYDGWSVAHYGMASVFALDWQSPGSGDAGAFVVIDREIESTFRSIISGGTYGDAAICELATDARLPELNAAIGLERMRWLRDLERDRRGQYDRIARIGRSVGLSLLTANDEGARMPSCVPFLLEHPVPTASLQNAIIEISKQHVPLAAGCDLAQDLHDRVVCFPCHSGVSELRDDEIADLLSGLTGGARSSDSRLPSEQPASAGLGGATNEGVSRRLDRVGSTGFTPSGALPTPTSPAAPSPSSAPMNSTSRAPSAAIPPSPSSAPMNSTSRAPSAAIPPSPSSAPMNPTPMAAAPSGRAPMRQVVRRELAKPAANTPAPTTGGDPTTVIGGVFSLADPDPDPTDVIDIDEGRSLRLANARSGIWLAAQLLQPGTVWVPSFHRVLGETIAQYGIGVRAYLVDQNLAPRNDWIEQVRERDLVVLSSVCGWPIDPNVAAAVRARGAYVLEDATQSMLSRGIGTHADLMVRSPWRFLGLSDGGILSAQSEEILSNISLETPPTRWWYQCFQASSGRRAYERRARVSNWMKISQIAEKEAPIGPYRMSDAACNLIKKIDLGALRERRCENYRYLAAQLGEWALIDGGRLPEGVVPFGFPMLVSDQDYLVRALARREIYLPTPSFLRDVDDAEAVDDGRLRYGELIVLPCDHRYDTAKMQRMVDVLGEILG